MTEPEIVTLARELDSDAAFDAEDDVDGELVTNEVDDATIGCELCV